MDQFPVQYDGPALFVARGCLPSELIANLRGLSSAIRDVVVAAMDKGIELDPRMRSWFGSGTWGLEVAFRDKQLSGTAAGLMTEIFNSAAVRTRLLHRFGDSEFYWSVSFSVFRHHALGQLKSRLAWHQDGKVYGPGIRALNCWIPLQGCGQDAPALDFVNAALDGLVTGEAYRAARSDPLSSRAYDDFVSAQPTDSVISPSLDEGDVCFFTENTVHRTAAGRSFTHERTALELRFFSEVPKDFLLGINLSRSDLFRLGILLN